jgi:hypothetical protein
MELEQGKVGHKDGCAYAQACSLLSQYKELFYFSLYGGLNGPSDL